LKTIQEIKIKRYRFPVEENKIEEYEEVKVLRERLVRMDDIPTWLYNGV